MSNRNKMIPVQSTSLLAFVEVLENLGERQRLIYKTLKEIGPANNQMISRKLHLQINSVTPRVKELRDRKLVGVAFEDADLFTGRKTIYWKVIRSL